MVLFLIVGLGGGCVAGYMYRGAGIKEAPEKYNRHRKQQKHPKRLQKSTPKVTEEATETPEPKLTEEPTETSTVEPMYKEPAKTPVPTVEPSQADKNGKKQEKNNINTYTNEQIAEQII